MLGHPKRLLIFNWRDPKHPAAGGAERYLLEVARRFVKNGHTVHWVTAGFRGGAKQDIVDGITVMRVGRKASVYFALPLYYLRHCRGRFDGIIDAENGVPFFSPLFSKVSKICLIFHVHQRVFETHLPFPLSVIFKWIEARLMPSLYARDRFVAISDDTRRDLIELGIPEARIDLAYSGYDSDLAPAAKSCEPSVLYVGRLKKYKRVDVILQAFSKILPEFPSATLTIAGTGDQEQVLRRSSNELGIAHAVRFEGFVSETRKATLYARSWVFAMASEMEGWGLTIIEAAACATPTVAVSVPGVREAVVDGHSGLLVEDCSALAPALARLLRDESLRGDLSRGAMKRSEAFSWDQTAREILAALDAA